MMKTWPAKPLIRPAEVDDQYFEPPSSSWAPERIWLQREQGEFGSHTWCEDSVGDGDLIEEVEYIRSDLVKSRK